MGDLGWLDDFAKRKAAAQERIRQRMQAAADAVHEDCQKRIAALEAELARVTGERDSAIRSAKDSADYAVQAWEKAEAAEAQVAALVEALSAAKAAMTEPHGDDFALLRQRWAKAERLMSALANLPRSASQREARRDAAERVAEALVSFLDVGGTLIADVGAIHAANGVFAALNDFDKERATAPAEVADG